MGVPADGFRIRVTTLTPLGPSQEDSPKPPAGKGWDKPLETDAPWFDLPPGEGGEERGVRQGSYVKIASKSDSMTLPGEID